MYFRTKAVHGESWRHRTRSVLHRGGCKTEYYSTESGWGNPCPICKKGYAYCSRVCPYLNYIFILQKQHVRLWFLLLPVSENVIRPVSIIHWKYIFIQTDEISISQNQKQFSHRTHSSYIQLLTYFYKHLKQECHEGRSPESLCFFTQI